MADHQAIGVTVIEQRMEGTVNVTVLEFPELKQWHVICVDRFGVKTERVAVRRPCGEYVEMLRRQHVRFSMSSTRRN